MATAVGVAVEDEFVCGALERSLADWASSGSVHSSMLAWHAPFWTGSTRGITISNAVTTAVRIGHRRVHLARHRRVHWL